MGTTVGDLLSLQNGSFGTVKIYNRKEIFSGSVKKAIELYSKYNVVSFGTNWYEDLCIYVEDYYEMIFLWRLIWSLDIGQLKKRNI